MSEVDGDLVSVIFAVVGEGTAEFAGMAEGERIDVLGPLGRPFSVKQPADYLLVGGGLGVPPLIYAAQCLATNESGAHHRRVRVPQRAFRRPVRLPIRRPYLSIDESRRAT